MVRVYLMLGYESNQCSIARECIAKDWNTYPYSSSLRVFLDMRLADFYFTISAFHFIST